MTLNRRLKSVEPRKWASPEVATKLSWCVNQHIVPFFFESSHSFEASWFYGIWILFAKFSGFLHIVFNHIFSQIGFNLAYFLQTSETILALADRSNGSWCYIWFEINQSIIWNQLMQNSRFKRYSPVVAKYAMDMNMIIARINFIVGDFSIVVSDVRYGFVFQLFRMFITEVKN